MGRVKVTGLRCERCGYIWVPRFGIGRVKICPKCKSPYWDRPRRAKPTGKEGK